MKWSKIRLRRIGREANPGASVVKEKKVPIATETRELNPGGTKKRKLRKELGKGARERVDNLLSDQPHSGRGSSEEGEKRKSRRAERCETR